MRYVRKFFLFIASSTLVSLLVFTTTLWTVNFTFGDRTVIKTWLEDSGIYDEFISEVAQATASGTEQDPDVAAVDLETLTTVANEAFPPEFLQQTLESAIDGAYDWLEQETTSNSTDGVS